MECREKSVNLQAHGSSGEPIDFPGDPGMTEESLLEHFAQIHKKAVGALQTHGKINCDICIRILIHFEPDPASNPRVENRE